MQSATSVTKRSMLKVIPDYFKTMTYTKVNDGDLKTINKIVYSVYPVKDAENGGYLMRKDGTPVTNVTAYIGFGDGTYTTSHGDTVINQLVSETGDFSDIEGQYEFDVDCPVKIITIQQTYGKGKTAKTFPIWAFEPM